MKRIEKMVYLAGPYSHRLKRIRTRRYEQLTEISARLLERDIINFSPITHSHNQQEFLQNYDTGFDDWRKNDLAFLSRCDAMFIAMIDGWDKSYGVSEELKFAKKNGIPVKYIHIVGDEIFITDTKKETIEVRTAKQTLSESRLCNVFPFCL